MGTAALSASSSIHSDSPAEDVQLLKQVARGEKKAFETLYRRYYRRLSQFVYRLTPNQQLGEEIVDDTMLAVWRSADKFAGRSKVSTWIFGIAYRRTMKSLDREMKHANVDSDAGLLDAQVDTDATRDPHLFAVANTMQRELDTFMEKLDVKQRVALQLTALGHSYPEISEIMDCPAGTVKTRVFKARSRLKGYIDSAGSRF
ncbi:MAG: sigma-70 family RNA polymerase sigma factor [Pseudomonadota bacterium]